jgi:hypothetical protein
MLELKDGVRVAQYAPDETTGELRLVTEGQQKHV